MVLVDFGGGGAEPVSVADVKVWCRIERSDEDALLAALITAARETVERETGVVLVKRGFRLALETVPADRRIAVPRRPLGAVTAVTAIEADGTPKGFAASAVERVRGAERLLVSAAVAAVAAGGIEVEFSAGYEGGSVPEALRLAVKQIVAAAYELRGAVPAEMQPAVVPKAARDLMASFRERRLR